MAKNESKKELLNKYSDGQYIDEDVNEEDLLGEEPNHTMLWDDWESTRDFLASKNLPNCIRQWEDYYEGRQTKYMPDGIPPIMVNVVSMIVDNKVASICENPMQISYISDVGVDSTMEVDRFSDYTLKNCHFETVNREMVRNAEVRGTSFLHVYWNEDAVGMQGIAKGSMYLEEINVLDVGVANPYEKDIQKQEWVIVASRESVKKIKSIVKDKDKKDLIVPDDNEVHPNQIEQLNEGKFCTVLTRYFRIDGEVYFEKGTKNVMLCEPVALNPYITYNKKKKARDAQRSSTPDEKLEKGYTPKAKFSRYPIEILNLMPSSNCYIGLSDIDGMVLGQNAINLMYSLALKNGIDLQAKYVVKDGALGDQVITNEIGQVLTDYYKGSGDGIKQITGQSKMTTEMLNLPLSLTEILRKVKNSSEVMTGDISGKELSGNAIAMLQAAAERPTDSQTRANQLFAEKCGLIFLQFYKFYYEGANYAYDINDYERMQLSDKTSIPLESIPNHLTGKFNGQKYIDTSFDIQVEAGSGGRFSQINQLSYIQSFMQMAPNLSYEQQLFFIKATPNYILKDKKDLISMIMAQEQSENSQLKQQLAQAQKQIELLTKANGYSSQVIKFLRNYNQAYENEANTQLANKNKEIQNFVDQIAAKEKSGQTEETNATTQTK